MADETNVRKDRFKELMRILPTTRGGERLETTMELYRLQAEDPDHEEWMKSSFPFLKVHSWSVDDPKHPRCVFSYTVPENNQNSMGNMHGGCTASLFDFCTSVPLCLVNKPDFWWFLGVSRTLNVTYLKPIPIGEQIFVECELMSIGKSMCTVRGVIRRQADGVVLATCEHGKFNSGPPIKSKM
ncbi:unnamed protein product [Discula destructiva]